MGSSRLALADVRVIAATNTNLKERVESKLFRDDLYYRLNALALPIPPLRERGEDIALLVTYFLERHATKKDHKARGISHDALEKLISYSWPGNVRELEGVILRALIFSKAPTLQAGDIDLPSSQSNQLASSRLLRDAKIATIANFERHYLADLLAAHQGNVTHAAKAAGKERRTFQRLLLKILVGSTATPTLEPRSFSLPTFEGNFPKFTAALTPHLRVIFAASHRRRTFLQYHVDTCSERCGSKASAEGQSPTDVTINAEGFGRSLFGSMFACTAETKVLHWKRKSHNPNS